MFRLPCVSMGLVGLAFAVGAAGWPSNAKGVQSGQDPPCFDFSKVRLPDNVEVEGCYDCDRDIGAAIWSVFTRPGKVRIRLNCTKRGGGNTLVVDVVYCWWCDLFD